MVKHLSTLAYRAHECIHSTTRSLVRIQYNLQPMVDVVQAQHNVAQLQQILNDIQRELRYSAVSTDFNSNLKSSPTNLGS
jgi:hypothetical protein